jgi:hypothetical protein
MSFHPWADFFKFASPRRRAVQARSPCPCRRGSGGHRLFLEALEDRSLPSVVGPLPIPGGVLDPTPFAGPDLHLHLPGPVDSSTPNTQGGDPSSIYDFNGFVGGAHIQGTGTDGSGNTLNWDADLRFMKGVYQGVDGNVHQGTFAFV